MHPIKTQFTIAMLVVLTGPLSASERDSAKPLIEDKLIPARLTHQEMAGSEMDRRIMELIYSNYMVLNLNRDWLDKFKNRTARGNANNVYYGIGKVRPCVPKMNRIE